MNDLDQLYQQIILDHAKARHGAGLLEAPEGVVHGESMQHNPVCGDHIQLRVQLEGSIVKNVSWEGDGCSISMASASVLSELATGIEREEFMAILDEFRELMRSRGARAGDEEILGDGAAFAGVSKFPARVKCAMLSWVAAEAALLAANA
ncbi:Fe-S cluster assembly sulfur transfer protein SufU [Paeniglutamicibacter sp. MACA_103]|uniref:Fe-S cluster assembly sulfur transfer protein SufU n=1 Tax=Paeniglutamicibacter sp. MACA_103 TaxID=3377337 RepID=UPI00389670A4